MANHRLRRGMHYVVGRREYSIEKRLPSGDIQVREVVTNVCSAVPEQDLIAILFSNASAELLGDNRNQTFLKDKLKKTRVSDLTLLAEDDPRRLTMERRRAYALEVIRQRPVKLTAETLRPIIDKIGRARGEIAMDDYKKLSPDKRSKAKARPSVSALIRWIKDYLKSGEDERAFIPATKARGNRTRKFSGPRNGEGVAENLGEEAQGLMRSQAKIRALRVAELLDESIDEVFLNEQRFSVQDVYDRLVVKIADDNKRRDDNDQLPLPHKSSVYDAVNKLDDYEVSEARYGQKIAEEKYRAYGRGPRPTRPLERVEADHTKIDLFVIDPIVMLPIGRPILTWMICVFAKMILGFYISFNPYGSLAILECLKHAIRPKNYVREKYPSIRNTWSTYGVMETLVLDNAKEFWGRHLEDACRQLGINLQYGQKRRAWDRATVERTFRTANTKLLHRQPGTTFSDIFDRADYEPGKTAVITPNTLDEIFHKFVIDVQQFSPHRGIMDVPALRWEKGVKQWPPALPAKAKDLDIVLGAIEHRTIQPYGIEIDTIIYNDEDLALLRSRSKTSGQFAIKRNLSDLSLIHVYDEKYDRYLPVPAVDQDYTRGLTLYQHKVIRRYVRETLKMNVDIVALCRAKWEIQEIIEREWQRIKGTTRVKMARYRKEGIQERHMGLGVGASEDWLDAMLNLPQTKETPLLMSPEAAEKSRKGMSNLENAFDSASDSGDTVGDGDATGYIEVPHRTRSAEGRKRKTKVTKKDKASGSASSPPGAGFHLNEDSTDAYALENNDLLDMSGWSGGYDLPAGEK